MITDGIYYKLRYTVIYNYLPDLPEITQSDDEPDDCQVAYLEPSQAQEWYCGDDKSVP